VERIEPCFGSWKDAARRLAPFAALSANRAAFEESDREVIDEALDDAECIVRQVLAYLPAELHLGRTE
jgi:hypothetical protein